MATAKDANHANEVTAETQTHKGEDFTVKVWTDKAVATEYKESLDIEKDPEKREKWLARQKALADRQLRMDTLRVPVSDAAEPNGDNEV